ncbi:MAG TPA: hypothetical protein VFS10_18720, partial [Pyrinomonadaceae bacterium]|nr:hypothetical protein [Pyrinomonadaceae bacterium]
QFRRQLRSTLTKREVMMRKSISVLALMLALTCFTYAGDIQNGVTGTPQPTPAPAVQEPTTDGEIDTGATADGIMPNDAATTFMQMVLNLLALS